MAQPEMVTKAAELRQAFQGGNDARMLEIMHEEGLLADLVQVLTHGSSRLLTFAAPYISDLANRVGWLESGEKS